MSRSETPTILVVEDNVMNMKLIVRILESASYAIITAADAEAGVEKARAEQPDLILLDIHLPTMDGLAAARLLKSEESTRHIPIIAVTALAMKGDEERILAAGCDGYIAKPLAYLNLLRTVAAHLGATPRQV